MQLHTVSPCFPSRSSNRLNQSSPHDLLYSSNSPFSPMRAYHFEKIYSSCNPRRPIPDTIPPGLTNRRTDLVERVRWNHQTETQRRIGCARCEFFSRLGASRGSRSPRDEHRSCRRFDGFNAVIRAWSQLLHHRRPGHLVSIATLSFRVRLV